MTTELSSIGPYKGLFPYSEEDAPFFFGREADRDLLIANLLGSPLTLLYGVSGVGKSSLLQAGVAYHVRRVARENLRDQGTPELALAMFSTWEGDPLPGLLQAVQMGIEQALPDQELEPVQSSLGLVGAVRTWTGRFGGNLLILLDQFEEYFLYHPRDDRPGGFADELARAVNQPDLRVGFLIAIREDALAWLDRFKGTIPGIFRNYLRLDHLDRNAARRAIRGPIEEYGRRCGLSYQVEATLIEEVLDQVAIGRVTVGEVGRRLPTALDTLDEKRIETPYLQLVMSRIWDEERKLKSRILKRATLRDLGGAERIVQTHLDMTLEALKPSEQNGASSMFRYLVTPRGAKVALTLEDLNTYTELPLAQLNLILQTLARRDVRILRQVADQPETPHYEIFHDVLATPILDWRQRFESAKEQANAKELRQQALLQRRVITGLFLLLCVVGILTFRISPQKERAQQEIVRGVVARALSAIYDPKMSVSSRERAVKAYLVYQRTLGRPVRLRGADFSHMRLQRENFWNEDLAAEEEGADLVGSKFVGAFLEGTILTRADLKEANFSGANLEAASLQSTDLSRALFYDANLTGADMAGAKLAGTVFSEVDFGSLTSHRPAILRNVNFLGAMFDQNTRFCGVDASGAQLVHARGFTRQLLIGCRATPVIIDGYTTLPWQRAENRHRPEAPAAGGAGPQLNPVIADLFPPGADVVRGGDGTTIELPAGAGGATLILNTSGPSAFREHAVELRDAAGKRVWSARGLVAQPEGAFLLHLSRQILAPGTYTLEVYGLDGARREKVQTYRFTIE